MAFNAWLNTFISIRSAVIFYNRFTSAIEQHNTAKEISDFAISFHSNPTAGPHSGQRVLSAHPAYDLHALRIGSPLVICYVIQPCNT
jgi:hypothetical protein